MFNNFQKQPLPNMKHFFIYISFLFLFYSCGLKSNRLSSDSDTTKEIPKVLLDEKYESFSRLKSSEDLMEEIYEDLLNNDEKLKKLDESIKENFRKMFTVVKDFEEYQRKSSQYYSSALSNANRISDSLEKAKVTLDIKNSQLRYESLIHNLSKTDSLIRETSGKIRESYIAFKIQKTLPIIEKFQKEKIVNGKNMDDFLQEQKKLLEEIK